MDKLRNKFKNLNWSNVFTVIITIVLVTAILGLAVTLFSGGSSGGGSSGASGSRPSTQTPSTPSTPSTPAEPITYYHIVFDANGGSGEMATQSVALSGNTVANITLNKNAFTKADNWYFIGWNTKADGSGISYSDEQYITVNSSVTLYAQWAKDVTINYYKIYACDWDTIYPPAENSGPVSKDGAEYYLRVTYDGAVIPYLGDSFTEDNETSPVRQLNAKVGSQLYIQLINKGDYDRGAVYVNGQKVAGNSEYCYYTFEVPDASNITMTFTWETEGTTITGDAQSYWICNINYE